MNTDWIAFLIVGIAGVVVARKVMSSFFQSWLAGPLSQTLLKLGKVKWAMRIRRTQSASACGNCSCK